jgi:hypothetical protein
VTRLNSRQKKKARRESAPFAFFCLSIFRISKWVGVNGHDWRFYFVNRFNSLGEIEGSRGLDKIFGGCNKEVHSEVEVYRVVSSQSEECCESHVSQKKRDMGHPAVLERAEAYPQTSGVK